MTLFIEIFKLRPNEHPKANKLLKVEELFSSYIERQSVVDEYNAKKDSIDTKGFIPISEDGLDYFCEEVVIADYESSTPYNRRPVK